ncbi:MAG: type II toxin-antitoxin system VapC family toxin [Candidatus Electrothrix sp. LOE2]|jgi:PIN domain nuclease of toxin-antitoxin system|nr:type II toxin-antitoxin system VapC family toxin [Candidatus Electrothrix sp. LOE2]
MKYLLDTHVLLWALFEDEKLSRRAKAEISNPNNRILISIVSYWEISLKYGIGKLELQGITPEELVQVAREIGFETLNISEEDAAGFYRLPKIRHKDPFDRLIIRQAITRKLPLISKDKMMREYQDFGLEFLWK